MQHITPDGRSPGSLRLAGLRIDPVFDGPGRVMAREVLVRSGVEDGWACHGHLLDDEGHLGMAMGGFLVRSGDRIALVDVGTGPIRTDVAEGGAFLDSLRTLGVDPADVTDVLFTHLHFDHVGWATQRGEVVFPNATYRVHQADWDHFMTGPDAEPGAIRKLSPLTERLATFDSDHTVLPGLDARAAPGHTPGTTIYVAVRRRRPGTTAGRCRPQRRRVDRGGLGRGVRC